MTDVQDFYAQLGEGEWSRFDQPLQRVEFMGSMRLIDRYISADMNVCDLGCGPGRYSIELLRRGNHVTLVDLTPELLDAAKSRIEREGLHADGFIVADARSVDALPADGFDAVLVMGPLYHLDGNDRPAVLAQAKRILRPGGIAILTYLNAWGLVRTGVTDFPARYVDADFVASLRAPGNLGIWHYTTPVAAREELTTAGLSVETYAGLEGFLGGMSLPLGQLKQDYPDAYVQATNAAVESGELPEYRDGTDHLTFVCRNG